MDPPRDRRDPLKIHGRTLGPNGTYGNLDVGRDGSRTSQLIFSFFLRRIVAAILQPLRF